jgi:hypothetical protein
MHCRAGLERPAFMVTSWCFGYCRNGNSAFGDDLFRHIAEKGRHHAEPGVMAQDDEIGGGRGYCLVDHAAGAAGQSAGFSFEKSFGATEEVLK